MKRKHLLIEAGQSIDATSRFYILLAGTTPQDNRDYLAVTAAAVNHNWYFRLYDDESRSFLYRVAESLNPGLKNPIDAVHVVTTNIRDYVRAYKAKTALSSPTNVLANEHQVRTILNLNYRTSHPSNV